MKRQQVSHRLTPKLVESLRSYNRQDFFHDLVAGITVGLVALPLAMAFAISSGVKPEAGIYTAIVAGFVVSAFGGSRCQIAGPTGAFVVIVAGIVTQFDISGLLTCTLMAGAMLVVMGLTGLGSTIRYIPRSVTIGFTNGIAVLIASTQIKDFLGLSIDKVPGEFLERMKVLGQNLGTVQPIAVAVASASLLIVLLWPRVTKRVPGSIVALLLATVVCVASGLSVETIGSKFGGIPVGLPMFRFPELRPDLIITLVPSALTVALLASIESLLSAVVADNMSGDRHKPDVELVAQGAANLLVPFFGGIPATGAIARTATNIRSGARSPISGIIHALTLLIILVAAAPLARFIPLATLSAVLFVVAYNMGEWREIGPIFRSSWADRVVWASTFALTVFADLTAAVEVGMVLAAFLYIRQVTETTSVEPVTEEYIKDGRAHILQDKPIPPYVTILRIHGPFLFGATSKLEEAASDLQHFGPVIILRLRNMTALDGTGLHALEAFAQRVQAGGRSLVICGTRRQPFKLIRHSKLMHIIGQENVVPHVEAALARAQAKYEGFGGVGKHLMEDVDKHPI
ncbi:MAG TPA: SulP family inorganic anion transporter [Gemmataceae bacterium]|jgi:SulP family sulfate permease|nr:SulP family inorganic anion transporter [Gemmataceae bacterium]